MGDHKVEFIAKTLNDIGKAVFIAGLISNFFPNLPMPYRVLLGVLSFAFIGMSIFIYPEVKK